MSTGTNKERITQNNGIINENNSDLTALKTRINNLPTSGDTTATASDIALGKTAVSKGVKITGTYTPPTVTLQSKDVTINQNGTTTITADTDYDGLSDVDVTVSGILDTSDANATANDIAKDKTAYVNGVKLTGTMEEPDYFTDTITTGSTYGANLAKIIKTIPSDIIIEGTSANYLFAYGSGLIEIPNLDTKDITSMEYMFRYCSKLVTIPNLNTSKVTTTNAMFANCTGLVTAPQLNLSNNNNANSMFIRCSNLQNVPVYDFNKVTNLGYIFENCPNLTNASLNNILATCISVSSSYLTHNKTLAAIGLTQTQAETCQTLSNWNDFVNAGWSSRILKTLIRKVIYYARNMERYYKL